MISYLQNNIRFNYRIAGLCIHQGKFLLHRAENEDFWSLPGGRAELLENSRETVVRELLEETGFQAEVQRPLWLMENFFDYNGEKFHEIQIVYQVSFPEQSPIMLQNIFYGEEADQLQLIYKWFHPEELTALVIRPAFLQKGLKNIPVALEHVIQHDQD